MIFVQPIHFYKLIVILNILSNNQLSIDWYSSFSCSYFFPISQKIGSLSFSFISFCFTFLVGRYRVSRPSSSHSRKAKSSTTVNTTCHKLRLARLNLIVRPIFIPALEGFSRSILLLFYTRADMHTCIGHKARLVSKQVVLKKNIYIYTSNVQSISDFWIIGI